MKKNDILFFIVTIVLLSLFSGIVITGVIRKESFCLMICLIAGLLIFSLVVYLILDYKSTEDIKKLKFNKLNEILGKVKFPDESLVDIETVTNELKTNGDREEL